MANVSKSQIFFWLLVWFISGVALRSFVRLPIGLIGAFLLSGFVLAAVGLIKFSAEKKLLFYALFIFAFSLGMLRHFQKAEIIHRELDDAVGRRVSFTAIVEGEPLRKAKNQQLVIKVPDKNNQRLMVVVRSYPEFDYGDELKISGLLSRPENFSDDFDYKNFLAKDDVYYLMRFPEVQRSNTGRGNFVYQNLFLLKKAFSDRLQRVLPEPESAFIGGLILGERRAIPADITAEFARTGTSHIVALSGYNITIIASALMRFLGAFSLPLSFTLGFSALGIVLFTLLTGASASVVRASIMGLLVLLAQKEGRLYHMRNALLFAGAVMIFQNPAILRFDASFQLSFLATIGLLYVSPIFDSWFVAAKNWIKIFFRNRHLVGQAREYLPEPRKSLGREILVATLAAQVFVLPLLVANFGRLSVVSPLANLAVLPFIPLTMFLGFAAGLAGFIFTPLAELLSWASWAFAHYELSVIGWFSVWPLAAIEVGKIHPAIYLAIYGALLFWLWRKLRKNVSEI